LTWPSTDDLGCTQFRLAPLLDRRGDDAVPIRLGEEQHVAADAPRLRTTLSGRTTPITDSPELRLGVIDSVTAHRDGAGLHDLLGAPRTTSPTISGPASTESEQVERGERADAHRIDVGERLAAAMRPKS